MSSKRVWACSGVAVLLGVVAGVIPSTAAASDGPCSYDAPKGDKRSESRAVAPDRYQEIEKSSNGRRHLTGCNRDGSLIRSEEFFRIVLPSGQAEEVLTSVFRPVGDNRFQYLEHLYPGHVGVRAASRAVPSADATSGDPRGTDDSCTNSSYTFRTSPATAWKSQYYTYYARQ
jgi:hypothetical protein